MEITPGTYTVRLDRGLSGKRFRDAVDLIKKAGGKFNGVTKAWTVTFDAPQTTTRACSRCGGTGNPIVNEAPYTCNTCPGMHHHADVTCERCSGTGEVSHTDPPRVAWDLNTLADAYDATVERV